MRWRWRKASVAPTPEQQARADGVVAAQVKAYHNDWGIVVEGLSKDLSVTRLEAFLYLTINHVGLAIEQLERATHPKFNPECAHCVEQKRTQDIASRYMEQALKFMAQHQHDDEGDDWKPIL